MANELQTRPLQGQWWLIAIGKAAASMAEGAVDVLGDAVIAGLVISKTGHFAETMLDARFARLEAEHPVPGAGSLAAGRALLEFCDALPSAAQVLCCVFGGASSLAEALPEGMTLEQLRDITACMLGSGMAIGEMNRVRKSLSHIKGGRLAQRLKGHAVTALYISDVPGDDIAVIGSGPLALAPTPDISADAPALPAAVAALLQDVQTVPAASADSMATVQHRLVATLALSMQAAAKAATDLGYTVHLNAEFMDQEATLAAQICVARLKHAAAGVHIQGGESVVFLPPQAGRGGRNQHLALAAACEIAGDDSIVLLAAGTDGSDGPTCDAGGLVDGGSLARGELAGLVAADCLQRADAGSFLQASGDLVNTGPTGTNVMDLVIAIKR